MLELYHFYGATCGLKARLAVAEKQANIVDRTVDRAFLRTPEYLAINPNGAVPTLVHDGQVLTESTVIINYLDDLIEDRPLKPRSAMGAALTLWWMKRADELLQYIGILTYTVSMRPKLLELTPMALKAYLDAVPSRGQRMLRTRIIELGYDNPEFQMALGGLRSMADEMEAGLSQHRWLADEQFTLADIAMTSLMERLEELSFSGLWRPGRPALCAWWDGVRTRPSYAACVLQTPNPEAPQHRGYGKEAWAALEGV